MSVPYRKHTVYPSGSPGRATLALRVRALSAELGSLRAHYFATAELAGRLDRRVDGLIAREPEQPLYGSASERACGVHHWSCKCPKCC